MPKAQSAAPRPDSHPGPRPDARQHQRPESAPEPRPAGGARPRPPFRADHVGSLLRPPGLLQARDELAARRITADKLRIVEDAAIREVVRMQQELGLQSATDGELRRESWHMDFIYQLGGIRKVQDDTIRVAFRNKEKTYQWAPPSAHVVAPVTLSHTIFGEAFAFLADTVTAATPKLTIPSPSMVHYRGGRSAIDRSVYPDLDQFWADLTAAYAEQVRRLYQLGCRYLQLDDISLAYLNDPAQREHVAEIGGDPAHQHEVYIANINRALAGRPADLAVTTHMCRGNNQSMWAAEGGYDFVAEALFNKLEVDGFFCEWDDERSGGFEPLRFVPKGKRVVLGLVTTKRGELESKDSLKRRLEAASRFVDIDQLCLSPQCGFSSTKEGNDLTQQQQWAKLRLIVETAQEVWGSR
jgi:5-methyltetrahydropteroyltriglutamate--homocysteine methyltransferase